MKDTSRRMPISQNLRFAGEAPPDNEPDRIAGASIAKLLRSGLEKRAWRVSRVHNWRDCGWFVECARDEAKLEVVLTPLHDGPQWLLQVAAAYRPGLIGRLMGKVPTAGPAEIFTAAKEVHEILSQHGNFGDFKWCWDGFPEDDGTTEEPTAPA